jgi:tetratricopeptide (TPR) repeat protein
VSKVAAIAATWLLSGCMAVGVPATSDPWKQFEYACALMHSGRVIAAAPYLREALEHYRKGDEYLKLAVVEMEYAVFVESPAFTIQSSFARERAALGGRAGIPARARELNLAAKANLEKVLALPPERASPADRTQALIFLAEAHAQLGEFREACATLERAAQGYRLAEGIAYRYSLYGRTSVPEYLEDRRDMFECAQG